MLFKPHYYMLKNKTMLPFVSANLHIFRLPGPTSPKCIQNWHGIQPTEYSISLNKYCKTMVGFSFILCPSIMHQEALVLPSYRPTYVVCKNMSMGEMEKPSIQSFKVTIDHTHAHMRKFSFLKQTYSQCRMHISKGSRYTKA